MLSHEIPMNRWIGKVLYAPFPAVVIYETTAQQSTSPRVIKLRKWDHLNLELADFGLLPVCASKSVSQSLLQTSCSGRFSSLLPQKTEEKVKRKILTVL